MTFCTIFEGWMATKRSVPPNDADWKNKRETKQAGFWLGISACGAYNTPNPNEPCRIRKRLRVEGTPENLRVLSAEGATLAETLVESLRQKDGAG